MWGALTVPLARKQCRVVAIDQTEDSLVLLKQRLADEDLNNVSLVCGNLKKIRFKKNSVDKVIVNGEEGTITNKVFVIPTDEYKEVWFNSGYSRCCNINEFKKIKRFND